MKNAAAVLNVSVATSPFVRLVSKKIINQIVYSSRLSQKITNPKTTFRGSESSFKY